MKKIYIYPVTQGPDIIGVALCEDGEMVGQHLSSNLRFFKSDMDREYKHERYKKHCPEGYEIVWVDDPKTHEGVQSALALNKANYAEVQS